ncbi:LacI family DNA-binding transcriptional regulator [Microbacterium indicum]|uniref:LacI family DNA-binding transcriptional regulator n=1 Tax=Microbacterium indicum TaxID=358100 RepID=UPI0004237ED7|nr:LacI family DNA-binding transcriptional regulator [Microbacterium indicum]
MTLDLPRPARTTITDVARAAGVSVATVSKVINGRDGIAAATTDRVLKVVADLGYERSLVAASLRGNRTNVIGVLVAEFEPFALQLLAGMNDALSATRYDVLAYAGAVSAGSHQGWENRSLSRLGGTLIDGAILVTPTVTLPKASIPIVAIDPHSGARGAATVDTDNLDGARAATRHLIESGHTRIAHLRGRDDLESAALRERGYREALDDAGIPALPDLVVAGGYRAEESTRAAHDLLALPEPPTAVFAANDVSALEMMRVAAERGLSVPGDLSVVGFDDIPAATAHGLTTVRQPLGDMGRAAVDMMVRLLADDAAAENVRLPAELVVRSSTARL